MSRLTQHFPDTILPYGMMGASFIAGGYAACPSRAQDIDLWVMDSTGRLEDNRSRILAHLLAAGYDVTEENTREGFRVNGFGYDEMNLRILKVGYVRRPDALPIHIMVTDAPLVAVLLHFDVSTHQCAIAPTRDGVGDVVRGPQWTDLTEEPVQLRETSATNTRMEKIRTRYADMRTNG